MNLAQKYTDEFYATRLEIEKQMPIIGINALWNEILQYRNNFRKETMICGIKYSVVLTPAIQSWIKQTEQELQFHELLMHIYDDQLFDAHFFQLSPLIQCFFIYHIESLYVQKGKKYELLSAHEFISSLFEESRDSILNQENTDITRPMQECLSQVCSQYKRKMIECRKKVSTDPKTLAHLYPQLVKRQCLFYASHAEKGYYYDVMDYVEYFHCSYETGRQHLLRLAECGLYEKKRVGKKDVYTVNL